LISVLLAPPIGAALCKFRTVSDVTFRGYFLSFQMTPSSVAVFLKEPVAGRVKTRLARQLGPDAAAALYRNFIEDTIECLGRLPGPQKFAYYTPATAVDSCPGLLPAWGGNWTLRPQRGDSLGERLSHTFSELFRGGSNHAVVVGTDCPLLDCRLLHRAFVFLADHDLVLGPAKDGGYYLIGLRQPVPELFEEIPWSSPKVLERTLEQARDVGLSSILLTPLDDVDVVEDLAPLRVDLLEAWREVAAGKRRDFPRRTFRQLFWWPPPTLPGPTRGGSPGASESESGGGGDP